MNVTVKHEGTNVTDHVISYTRTQNICSGIGTLEIYFDYTLGHSFDPWDTITIKEGSHLKGTYYVSVSSLSSDGTYHITCQDGSKRLSDYFIDLPYIVDYPSMTRYWIEKFLDEAGVTYVFTTSDYGNLLSNNTSLGMVTAYDQILTLLQMSGWYMYFDEDSTCIIGDLNADISNIKLKLTENDLISIKVNKDDKMLRNRAVVWGAADPTTSGYIFADVRTITKWNYGKNDLRTVVLSNSNIPNQTTAYELADKLIKEFAKITISKTLQATGERNVRIGDFVLVKSRVFKGIGMVTTVGSELSRDGLLTDIILDERCPRLFGYFDYGDYVYIGTDGSGVWRKHIKWDDTWYPYSSGLTDNNIVDLYKNEGLLSAVGYSGEAYYSFDYDGYWEPITISGLPLIYSGDGFYSSDTIGSGFLARAIIQDRTSNNIRIAYDNYSGMNNDPYNPTYSGLVWSGSRAWIVDYDPTGSGYNSYPISVSGNYSMLVVDIENDGTYDYVGVEMLASGAVVQKQYDQYVYGYYEGQNYQSTGNISFGAVSSGIPSNYTVNLDTNFFTNGYTSYATYDDYDTRGIVGMKAIYSPSYMNYIIADYVDYNTGAFTEHKSIAMPGVQNLIRAYKRQSKYVYTILYQDTPTSTNFHFATVDFTAGSITNISDYTIAKVDASAYNLIFSVGNTPPGVLVEVTARSANIVFGIQREDYYQATPGFTYDSKLYGLTFNLDSCEVNLWQIYNAGGTIEHPKRLFGGPSLFGVADTGTVMAKIGYAEFEYNLFNSLTSAKWKVINFTGNNFDVTEQALVNITIPPGGYKITDNTTLSGPGTDLGGGIGYSANTYFFDTIYTIFNVGGTLEPDNIIRSVWPLKNDYLVTTWNSGPVPTYYSQTGGMLTTSFFATNGIWDAVSMAKTVTFQTPSGYTLGGTMSHLDSVNGDIYCYGKAPNADRGVFEFKQDGSFVKFFKLNNSLPNTAGAVFNSENFILVVDSSINPQMYPTYIKASGVDTGYGSAFTILRRDQEADFTILTYTLKRPRLDDSLTSHLIVMEDTLATTQVLDIFPSSYDISRNPFVNGGNNYVNDYRYMYDQPVLTSGSATDLIYTVSGQVFETNLNDFYTLGPTPVASGIFDASLIGSGWIVDKIETSNYGTPSQYIFITINENGVYSFYQRDENTTPSGMLVGSGIFTEMNFMFPSGSKTNIIRLDDRI